MKTETIESYIDEGVKLSGRLVFQGVLKIAGTFEGEIFTPDKLVVLPTAYLNANIEADTVIISGKVEGNIIAKSKVEIKVPANFKGTVLSPSLSVEEGAQFEGASYMPSVKDFT